ncbi:MAG: hypothetical protein ACXWVD_16520 [Telluria sp.]
MARPPTAALNRLARFLRDTQNTLSPSDAAAQAIDQWIAAAAAERCARPMPLHGYQWKSLFLPDGSELRASIDGHSHFAQVEQDAIVFEGRRVSPHQMTLAIAGAGRNAWKVLWVRLPGDKKWKSAWRMRLECEQQSAAQPASPAEAIQAASDCMARTMQTFVDLIGHACAQPLPHERRITHARRTQDQLGEACLFD